MIPSATEHQARQQIKRLVDQYHRMTEDKRAGITEAGVVNQFLAPFFAALGWPVTDPDRYKYELHTYAGRPDVTLIPEKGDPLFVEAKRFGLIKQLETARRTLSGIVTPQLEYVASGDWILWLLFIPPLAAIICAVGHILGFSNQADNQGGLDKEDSGSPFWV